MKLLHKTRSQKWPLRLFLRWTLGLGVLLVAMWIYFDLAEDVWSHEGFAWDGPIIVAIHQFSNPALDKFMLALTQFGQLGAILVAIAAAVYFAEKRKLAR